ncbi:hypothetical protein ScPMuIL_018533 [Solemya velum]
MATKLEINFSRLLNRCEHLASDKSNWGWRLEKYIEALHEQLSQLKSCPSKPCQETINNYCRKVEFLKGLIDAEKLPSSSEKALAAERLSTVSSSSQNNAKVKELHLQTKSRYQSDMRDELLGSQKNGEGLPSGELRQRRQQQEEEDIDSILQRHRAIQEKLADDMLSLTRTMKETATVANQIVKDDTKKLSDSTKLADVNYSRLKVESERLEAHTKTCSWWIWIMLIIVTATFLSMILFMRLFSKGVPKT